MPSVEALESLRAKSIECNNRKITPAPKDINELEDALLKIVQDFTTLIPPEDLLLDHWFVQKVLDVWSIIVALIQRRIFDDDTSGATLIKVNEIDYLYNDALCSLYIGACLPVVDFELTTALGYKRGHSLFLIH